MSFFSGTRVPEKTTAPPCTSGSDERTSLTVIREVYARESGRVNLREPAEWRSIMLMSRARIAITLDQEVLAEIDRLVRTGVFPNRSRAIEEAVRQYIARRLRLAREGAKLDQREEQAFAEEGIV